jgi:hypothetical protein
VSLRLQRLRGRVPAVGADQRRAAHAHVRRGLRRPGARAPGAARTGSTSPR